MENAPSQAKETPNRGNLLSEMDRDRLAEILVEKLRREVRDEQERTGYQR